jgi:hypothetical protein
VLVGDRAALSSEPFYERMLEWADRWAIKNHTQQ